MKKIKTKLPWIIALIVLALALIFGFWPETVEVDVAKVTRGGFDITVDDDGETQIQEKYVVSAPIAGKLLRVLLEAGDEVVRGKSELAQIEPSLPDLMDARKMAEASARLRAAEANVERAKATLLQAQNSLELATHHYARAQNMLPQKAISPAEFDEVEHRYQIAKAEVRSAEFGVDVAEFEQEYAQAAVATYGESSASDIDAIRLVSPIDGAVLRVFQEDSSVVTAGLPILELGDPRDLEVKIDVLSTEAVKINPGDRVLIEHWGGKETLEARVRRVEPSAFLKISALGVEEKRVNVIADFANPEALPQSIGDGFRIEARIVTQSTDQQSLKVPAGALFQVGDTWSVFRVSRGRAEQRTVVIGLTNGTETEIAEGLEEGDEVILHPTERISDGIRVSPSSARK